MTDHTPPTDPYTPYKDKIKPKYFTCFNRAMRTHRIMLCDSFYSNRLFTKHKNKHISTFIGAASVRPHVLALARQDVHLIPQRCIENGSTNRDTVPQHGDIGEVFIQTFHDTYYDIITEYYDAEQYPSREKYKEFCEQFPWAENMCISEKIYRSIYYRRPFLVLGNRRILSHLHSLGYKTFGNLFDESYDDASNIVGRMKAMMSENMKIVNRPIEELHEKCYTNEMQDIIEHNRENLIQHADFDSKELRLYKNFQNS